MHRQVIAAAHFHAEGVQANQRVERREGPFSGVYAEKPGIGFRWSLTIQRMHPRPVGLCDLEIGPDRLPAVPIPDPRADPAAFLEEARRLMQNELDRVRSEQQPA